jgi:hypothetical protein
MQDRILIIDFGSQVTQLIARRIREAGVYSEIVPFQSAEKALDWPGLKGIILSGGPASVHEGGSPRAPDRVFTRGLARARHLLWRADHVRPAGRQGGSLGPSRIRQGLRRGERAQRAVRWRLGKGRAPPGVDEPWRPGDRHPRRLQGHRHLGGRALRGDRRRAPPVLRHAVPHGGRPHAGRREALRISRSRSAAAGATGRWRISSPR